MARALMFQGTGSDVGKTVLVAGFCRLATRRGLKVRPFKPQNMSNNAAVAGDGHGGFGEIGRAQWLQAFACRTDPLVDMNPVLLKPQSETGSQIILHGKMFGQAKGRDYQKLKPRLLDAVMESYRRLGDDADLILVEGAGSPAEINLRAGDIANMGFATRAQVPVVLVGDIDRGGVIASLVGTHHILDPCDRAMIVGYLINKFRGNVALFDEGINAIGRFTGWPQFGVVPWLSAAARLPAEDSVILEKPAVEKAQGLIIAVPVLPRIANFDDIDPLKAEPDVEVIFVKPGNRLPENADLVILPGSKSTIADLAALRAQGWDRDLRAHRRRGGHIVGLCGGYQMLGRILADPDGLEGTVQSTEGLGLLDIRTVLKAEKSVRISTGRSCRFDAPVDGYEIHLGETTGPDCARPVALIGERPDGASSADGKVFGTYIHGLFSSDGFRTAFLESLGLSASRSNHMQRVDRALDEIADKLAEHVDFDGMLSIAEGFARRAVNGD